MEQIYKIHDQLEKKVEALEQLCGDASTSAAQGSSGASEVNNKIETLRVENNKLRYQIQMLETSIEKYSKSNPVAAASLATKTTPKEPVRSKRTKRICPDNDSTMMRISTEIGLIFETAIRETFPTLTDIEVDLKPSEFADFQCNNALKLTKVVKKKPADIAKQIIEKLDKRGMIESVDVSGPGFINIILSQEFVQRQLLRIVTDDVKIQLADKRGDERVIVDYSSPNIAKEMHVGHLRSTIIGDSVARLLEFVGYDVLRINHIGDWGTQFGMLLAHLIDTYPDFKSSPPPIANLQIFYKQSKKRFDEEEEFKKRAYETTVLLQAKSPDMIMAWKQICEISRQEFNEVYRILNVSDKLTERGESFYHDLMHEVVADLTERKLLCEEDGRKVFYPDDKNLPPLTIVKSDGGFTYDTSDMAAIRQRANEERATRIIYTTDLGQSVHFQTLFSCAKIAGYYDPSLTRIDHLTFGEDKKKFKTRSGETVRLKDLINEGLERSLQKLKDNGRDKELTEEELKKTQYAVAIGCIKYADLSHDRNNDYIFSFDRMLDDKGNTAVYLLYALTRIRSIIRNASLKKSAQEIGLELCASNGFKLEHPREIKLAKFILNFPDVIADVADSLCPHKLCMFIYDLSTAFSEFYDQCYVIQKVNQQTKVNLNRIILCEATAKIMECSLAILGIQTVERM